MGDNFVCHVNAIREVCLSDWRSRAQLANSRIGVDLLDEPVADVQDNCSAEEVGSREIVRHVRELGRDWRLCV